MKHLISIGSIAVSSLALNFIAVGQVRAVNLVQNGGFQNGVISSSNPGNTNGPVTTSAYLDSSVTLPGWTFSTNSQNPSNGRKGFNFLVASGSQFKTNLAANNPCNPPFSGTCGGTAGLFGSNGQTVVAPDGSGWFIAADAFFDRGAINQTLTGLTSGSQYTVSFYQASGQQQGQSLGFSEFWNVSFGGNTQTATVMTKTGAQPVSGWTQQSLTFTANAATQVLSFLAQANNDVPPFALLSGVSVEAVPSTSVPEPESYIGTLVGLGFIATIVKSRLKKQKSAENN